MSAELFELLLKEITTQLQNLELEKLESEWVIKAIDSDFLKFEELPLVYEEILNELNVNECFSKIQKYCLKWLEVNKTQSEQYSNQKTLTQGEASTDHSQINENEAEIQWNKNGALFWGCLFEDHKLDIKSLQAVLGFLIDSGSHVQCKNEDREKSFSACNLYFTLVCIPGSMAFKVFNQMLYSKALSLINISVKIMKCRKEVSTSKKNKKGSGADVEDIEEDSFFEEDDIKTVEKHITKYLDSLSLVAQYLSLKRYPTVLKETAESIMPMINLGKGPNSIKALEIVQHFCDPLHGDALQTVHYIFQHILPYLTFDPNEKDLSNKDLTTLKDISFNIIAAFVQKFGESIYPLVKGLIQHISANVVDRAELRQKTAQNVIDIMQLVSQDCRKGIVHWFLLLAHHEQASLRLFALEVLTILLHSNSIDEMIIAVVCSQCSDPSATVRAKALSILSDCIESTNSSISAIFDNIFSNTGGKPEDSTDLLEFLQQENQMENPPDLLPRADSILNLLKERANDDKVHVRKNALHLLITVLRRNRQLITDELLTLLGDHCQDIALLVRRFMAQALTEFLLLYSDNVSIQRIWSHYVLPMVLDGETRVQEKALECIEQLLLRPLVNNLAERQLSWSLLEIITDHSLSVYLSKAVEMWARQQLIQSRLLRILRDNCDQHPKSAWTFMAIVSGYVAVEKDIKAFAVDFLRQHIGSSKSTTLYCLKQVCKLLGAVLSGLNSEQQREIREIYSRHISEFQLPTELISQACDLVVYAIQQEIPNEEAARKETSRWANDLLNACGEYLSNSMRKQEPLHRDEEEQIVRRIFTLGCAALHCPWSINKRHFLILQHAAFQPESGVEAPIPSSQTQPVRKLPAKLQAAAVISLGKLCVQHEEMAKQLIPGLGRLLETTPHEAVRNNIICILCDLVVRYGTAVDPVMSQVTACLRDPSPLVRHQTLVLLIHLLQEDYLKIRGTFFFRILQLTCDEDEKLRELALFYITQRLLHRQPNIIQQHFIESVFHYNDYKGHPTFNKFVLTEHEKNLFSIAGPNNAKRRFDIYVFMLQNMDDEARFQLTFRLSRDVLLGVVEGVMPLTNSATEAVLKDALAILASEDIKLASLTASVEEDPVEKEDVANVIVQSTKKAIIAQVVKRNVIENIIPIVVELKRKLAVMKSPLMGNLMEFLRELVKDYKGEIQEVLAADQQLMAEIDFDLKRFEQQQKELQKNDESQISNQQNNPAHCPLLPSVPAPTTSNVQIPEDPVKEPSNGHMQQDMEVVDTCEDREQVVSKTSVPDQDLMKPPSDVRKPRQSKRKSRFLLPRIMSTPNKDITISNITFLDHDADLSVIPHASEQTKRKRGQTGV